MPPEAALESPPLNASSHPRTIDARLVRYVPHPVTGTLIRRSFKLPRHCLAVETAIELAELPQKQSLPEPVETLQIVYVFPEAKELWDRVGSDWLTPPDSESPESVSVSVKGERIVWRPGRVLIEGENGLRNDVIAGLIEFAFYEGELRALEQSLAECEAQARADVPKTFLVQRKDRAEWPRFHRIMERLAQLRITCAALESKVQRGSRVLTKRGREVATRLFHATGTKEILEGLDTRLEACEDLYEGAIDRIADYHGWHNGHVLEVIIIALLVIEAVLMGLDLAFHFFGV